MSEEEKPTKWAAFIDELTDHQISWCVGLSLIGFVLSVWLLMVGNSGQELSAYGTIRIVNKTVLADSLIHHRLRILEDSLKNSKNQVAKNKFSGAVNWCKREQYWLYNRNEDTSVVFFAKLLQVDPQKYLAALNSPNWKDDTIHREKVLVRLIDTSKVLRDLPLVGTDTLRLQQNKSRSRMDFFAAYPAFGFWLAIGIAQGIFWWLLIPLLIGNQLNLKGKITNYALTADRHWINALVPIVFIGLFCCIFYQFIVDHEFITDHYFLNDFNDRMLYYGGFGYAIACFCFYNFLTLASQFSGTTKNLMESLGTTADQQAAALAEHQALDTAFQNAFICSALVLSFFVFWEGLLVTALNGTEAFRFYQQLSGKTVLSADFVYLMGLLHTCILLVFYLPVKLKYNSLQGAQQAVQQASGLSSRNIWPVLSSNLGTVLVTASPLIAGFVQSLLKLLAGN